MIYNTSRTALLAIAASLVAGSSALELTPENFAEMTAGKTVFLKFYAPWCGHCKAMAGDWAKLEADFKDHAVALVASVDCADDDNQEICSDFNVEVRPCRNRNRNGILIRLGEKDVVFFTLDRRNTTQRVAFISHQ